MRLVRERFPHMLICVASNGLCLPPYLDHLADIGVSHVTVTVNAVDPEIGRCICSWVRDGRVLYRGIEAAGLLLERQEESIRGLKARGIVVKANTIVIPGINNGHVPAVASRMAELGVDLLNCMPMYPNRGTPSKISPNPPRKKCALSAEQPGSIFSDAALHSMQSRRRGTARFGPLGRIPKLPRRMLRFSAPGNPPPACGRGNP